MSKLHSIIYSTSKGDDQLNIKLQLSIAQVKQAARILLTVAERYVTISFVAA